MEHKTEQKEEQANALQETTADLTGTQKELDAAPEHHEELKPTYVSGVSVSLDDRVARPGLPSTHAGWRGEAGRVWDGAAGRSVVACGGVPLLHAPPPLPRWFAI